VLAAEIPVETEVSAHEATRLGAGLGEVAGAGARPPIPAQRLAHRRPRRGLAQHRPAVARLMLNVVRHDQLRILPPRLYNQVAAKSMEACDGDLQDGRGSPALAARRARRLYRRRAGRG